MIQGWGLSDEHMPVHIIFLYNAQHIHLSIITYNSAGTVLTLVFACQIIYTFDHLDGVFYIENICM